jgi:hypothetical protein
MFGRKIIAELSEIGENLVRSPLTPAQGASAIFCGKAIYEELHPETKAGVAGAWLARVQQTKNLRLLNRLQTPFGESRRSVEITAARGEALGDDLAAVTGTALDKGVELDALAKTTLVKRSSCLLNGYGVSFRFIGCALEKNAKFEGPLVDALRCFRA